MKEVIAVIVAVAGILSLWATEGSTKAARDLDGKTVRDAAGNYYRIEANVGDNVFLRKIDIEKF